MNKKYAVVLSGCGAKDGAEIHESVSALYAIAKAGDSYKIFAPDTMQKHVVNHINDSEMEPQRNVLIEAARIARGDIYALETLKSEDFDVLVIPGGFGAAKNLFTFAIDWMGFTVMPDMERIVRNFHEAKKPIGAMCISPVMIAKVLGEYGVDVTLGAQSDMGKEVESHFGAKITATDRSGVVVDTKNRVVTTPCYMYGDSSIVDIFDGAQKMVESLDKM